MVSISFCVLELCALKSEVDVKTGKFTLVIWAPEKVWLSELLHTALNILALFDQLAICILLYSYMERDQTLIYVSNSLISIV